MKNNNFIGKLTKPFVGIFQKKSANITEGDYSQLGSLASLITPFMLGHSRGIGWLSALGAINYYNAVSPIANAVDLVAETASRISIAIYDRIDKEYIKDTSGAGTPAKALKLLRGCNFTQTYTDFMRGVLSYYLITGNAFVISQSTAEKTDIIEIFYAKPQDITIYGAGTSLATVYMWRDGDRELTFRLNYTNYRYEAEDKNGFYYELKHIKDFNPKYNVSNLWGMSKLTQLYLEMEQYISGTVHNNSLLKNGAKPSGVLTLDEEMSDDAYERARREFNEFYSGAENAGKVLMFEGTNAKFQSFLVSPKDMDYPKLVEWVENSLYSRLKIPRALISDKAMTYNNLNEALRQLYIMSIFPSFDMVLECLSSLIFDRAKDGERYELYYDTKDIEAFAEKYAETDEKIVRLGITTYNEARSKFNLPDLAENGDVVFAPAGKTPLSDVGEENSEAKEEELKKPKEAGKQPEEIEEKSLQTNVTTFRRILERQRINASEIEKAVEKIYG